MISIRFFLPSKIDEKLLENALQERQIFTNMKLPLDFKNAESGTEVAQFNI